jgi:quinoprotein glucose dehydrogenase
MYQAGIIQAPDVASSASESGDEGWSNYGNDQGGSRFSPLAQITAANVSQLELAWTARLGVIPAVLAGLEATPIEIGDTVYLCTYDNQIFALDAKTGHQRWKFDGHVNAQLTHAVCRGVAYYHIPEKTGACAERIFTATADARMFAVDARSGERCQDFGQNGEISLTKGMGHVERGYYNVSSAPEVVDGKVVVGGHVADNQMWGSPSGVIRAFDAVTGALAWAWDVGRPDQTGEPPEGKIYTHSTPNSWGPMSADVDLGLLYVPMANPSNDYFGGQRRPFDEKYNDVVAALDVHTGRPRWFFQTVHHDVWDFDIPSQPTLVDLTKNGAPVKALIMPTKRGELFFLDRATGEPIVPIEERPAPQRGKVPEEKLSPTQPYPLGLPSFAGADLTERSMWGISPLDQLWCRIKFRQARYDGQFTPPGLTPSIQYPAYIGGMEWSGVAVDQGRDIMIVPTNYLPNYVQLVTRAEADRMGLKPFKGEDAAHSFEGGNVPQAGAPYGALVRPFFSPLDIPCNQPPFGRLSALDLVSGKLIWSRVLGSAEGSGPWRIPSMLPFPIGTPLFGGAMVTRSGLTFIGAAQDRYIRAFDTATGKLLWSYRLPAGGNATPMSYQVSGRQYVVIAAGGNAGGGSRVGDYVMAFALPARVP